MINSYWLQKLVDLQPSKKIGPKKPWDIGDLWKPVSDWYLLKHMGLKVLVRLKKSFMLEIYRTILAKL